MFNICYCGVQAGYAHKWDCPRPLYRGSAADVEQWEWQRARRARAIELGAADGSARASWYFDGNTRQETYRAVLAGLEDGDPAVMDTLPSSPLSGEWAGDPTPATVLAELEADADDPDADDLLSLYEDAFHTAVHDDIEQAARAAVFTLEPYAWPGGYPCALVLDDGEYLCANCANDPSNPLHVAGDADGWRVEGTAVLEGSAADYDGAVTCSHCGAVLVPDDDDERQES